MTNKCISNDFPILNNENIKTVMSLIPFPNVTTQTQINEAI